MVITRRFCIFLTMACIYPKVFNLRLRKPKQEL
jgi:hypothetical protein